MSTILDLPSSASRDYRQPTEVGLQGIATPGQVATASESWFCLLTQRTTFLNAVIGFPMPVGGPSGGMIRVIPLQHPEYPVLYATGARSRGLGYDGTAANKLLGANGSWKYCKITVDFASRPYAMSGPDAFISISGQPATRSIPAPAVAMRIGGLAPVYDPGDEIDGEDMILTVHGLTAYSSIAYDAIRNHVNQDAFRGRPIGTCLYRGAPYAPTSNFAGLNWDAAHTISYSEVPWNFGYNTDGTLSEITRAATGLRRHPYADFNVLFT